MNNQSNDSREAADQLIRSLPARLAHIQRQLREVISDANRIGMHATTAFQTTLQNTTGMATENAPTTPEQPTTGQPNINTNATFDTASQHSNLITPLGSSHNTHSAQPTSIPTLTSPLRSQPQQASDRAEHQSELSDATLASFQPNFNYENTIVTPTNLIDYMEHRNVSQHGTKKITRGPFEDWQYERAITQCAQTGHNGEPQNKRLGEWIRKTAVVDHKTSELANYCFWWCYRKEHKGEMDNDVATQLPKPLADAIIEFKAHHCFAPITTCQPNPYKNASVKKADTKPHTAHTNTTKARNPPTNAHGSNRKIWPPPRESSHDAKDSSLMTTSQDTAAIATKAAKGNNKVSSVKKTAPAASKETKKSTSSRGKSQSREDHNNKKADKARNKRRKQRLKKEKQDKKQLLELKSKLAKQLKEMEKNKRRRLHFESDSNVSGDESGDSSGTSDDESSNQDEEQQSDMSPDSGLDNTESEDDEDSATQQGGPQSMIDDEADESEN